jgi:hypothetical protein
MLMMILSGIPVGAQQINQEVIACAGGYNMSSDKSVSVSWTLGETIVPTLISGDGSLILTHGFQQKLIVASIEDKFADLVKVNVFPNPVNESINIQFENAIDKEISISLLNAEGKLVKTDQIETTALIKIINLQDLAAGVYYLRLTKGNLVNVYKVVKL